jgi:uncharacterized protein YjdB
MKIIQWKKVLNQVMLAGLFASFIAVPTSVAVDAATSPVISEKEFNGDNARANNLVLGRKIQGNFSGKQDTDVYALTLNTTSDIQLIFNGTGKTNEQLATFQLSNSAGNVLINAKKVSNATSQTLVKQTLPKGKYYFSFKNTQNLTQAKNYHFTASVLPAVASVTLSQKEKTLYVNETATLNATVAPNNTLNKTVTWTSSNTSVATVDSKGKVTAKKAGSATITAKSNNAKSATSKITVKNRSVTSVSVSPTSKTIEVGATTTATASIKPTNSTIKTVSWKSSDSKIATVDSKGKITGKKAGKATITATTTDGKKTAKVTVTVQAKKVAVKSVSINAPTKTITVGKTTTVKATFNPTNASNKGVTWKSSNTKVATIDANGKITGKKAGKTTITVTTKDGKKTSSVTINVNATKPIGKTVYIAPKSGTKYHYDAHCRGLKNAHSISSMTENQAKSAGYDLCGWED